MVSIMIGQNNLCHSCLGQSDDAPSTYGRLLEESIDVLFEQVPRLFINLIIPSDITIVRAVADCT
jgi:phospholipase B1